MKIDNGENADRQLKNLKVKKLNTYVKYQENK